jgi:pyruvate carboxylase
MLRALSEYQVFGIMTTIPFFKRILNHRGFSAGRYTTHFIAELEEEEKQEGAETRTAAFIAAAVRSFQDSKGKPGRVPRARENNWKIQGRIEHLLNRL